MQCGSLIPWGWGWLHRSWSFAIPNLRLRLPPGIEACQNFSRSMAQPPPESKAAGAIRPGLLPWGRAWRPRGCRKRSCRRPSPTPHQSAHFRSGKLRRAPTPARRTQSHRGRADWCGAGLGECRILKLYHLLAVERSDNLRPALADCDFVPQICYNTMERQGNRHGWRG